MNEYICPLCQFNSKNVIRPYKNKKNLFENRYIVECCNCGLYSAYPMLSDKELIDYYKEYWQEHDIDKTLPIFIAQAQARYEFIKPFLALNSELNILDIGSGFGIINNCFAENNHRYNYDVIEVDNKAVAYLTNNIHPRNLYSNLDKCMENYQLIIASHILEHYKDIVSKLTQYCTKLTQEGLIFVEVPNKDFIFKQYNEPHVIFFSPETLAKLMEIANLSILRIDTCGNPISQFTNSEALPTKSKLVSIVKKIIPPAISSKIKNILTKRENYNCFNQYGGERQWIRLIAKKK